ncbi:unnamed protein product [Blepharisma stoltei]|uniref:Uncharacterized protein n=1 Tax=Blepharisma stoltei TaxID=1481888 RepID=A0AAU9IJU5_9CILI|nr:unnamed protein product [Blepharisma stoltei]
MLLNEKGAKTFSYKLSLINKNMNSLKQELYTVFNNLDTYDRLSKAKCYASAFGIQEALKHIYQDKIQIIGSELILNNSPAIDDEVNGVLSYTKKIEEAIRNDGEKLKRPIVAYWKLDASKTLILQMSK